MGAQRSEEGIWNAQREMPECGLPRKEVHQLRKRVVEILKLSRVETNTAIDSLTDAADTLNLTRLVGSLQLSDVIRYLLHLILHRLLH